MSKILFNFGDAVFDDDEKTLTFADGESHFIGRMMSKLVRVLVENPNRLMSKKEVMQAIWGSNADLKSRSLDQYWMRLKKLFNKHGSFSLYLSRVNTVGFIFHKADELQAPRAQTQTGNQPV